MSYFEKISAAQVKPGDTLIVTAMGGEANLLIHDVEVDIQNGTVRLFRELEWTSTGPEWDELPITAQLRRKI